MFQAVKSYNSPAHGATLVSSYSPSAIAPVINFHSGQRTLYWRLDLLNNDLTYKGDITKFASKMVISGDTTRPVGRTLDLDMVETVASQTTGTLSTINYLADKVQPVCLIQKATNEWLAFPMGAFLFKRPGVIVPGYAIVRHANMTDHTTIVQENAATAITTNGVGTPLTLPPGCRVIDVIRSLLMNSPSANSSTPDGTPWATPGLSQIPGCALGDYMPSNVPGAPGGNTPGDFPSISAIIPGTVGGSDGGYTTTEGQNYLDLINHLLFTIGCYPLMADERGIFRIQQWPLSGSPPLPDYTSLSSLYAYDTTSDSIITFGLTEDFNIDTVPNVVQVRVEDTSRTTFMATATNNDPLSPFSVARYGGISNPRRIVKIINDGQVPDTVNGGITSVTITSGGSGYTSAPTVTFSPPASGTTATGHTTLSGTSVSGVVIDNQGSGYTSFPTIGFSGGGGSGATATATFGDSTWAGMYAKQQLLINSWFTDTVTLPIAVNPLHAGYLDHDIITLNVYQKFYADGSAEDIPVIVSGDVSGLIVTEKFIVDGWSITANLATPGSGTNLTGNVGLTTVLEPREQKQGHIMTITCHRITSTVRSNFVDVT